MKAGTYMHTSAYCRQHCRALSCTYLGLATFHCSGAYPARGSESYTQPAVSASRLYL